MNISRELLDLCKNAHAASVAHDAKRKEEELLESKRKKKDLECIEEHRTKSGKHAELDSKINFLEMIWMWQKKQTNK